MRWICGRWDPVAAIEAVADLSARRTRQICVSSSVSPSSSLDSRVRRSELYRDVVCVRRLLRYEDILTLFVSSRSVGDIAPNIQALQCRRRDLRRKSASCDVGRAWARTASVLGRGRHFRGAAGIEVIESIRHLELSSFNVSRSMHPPISKTSSQRDM
jgi:hypothetical protein